MSTELAQNEKPETICSGTITEADLRRFAVFDESDRFVKIKPGVRSDDINPDWRTDALGWAHVLSAITISRQVKKADRARRIAEALTLQLAAGVFAKPHYESDEDGETFCFGQFWYLTEEERDELFKNYWESLETPGWLETPEAMRGIDHGLAVIEMVASAMRSLEDPEKIKFIRKMSVEMFTEWPSLFEDAVLQDALKAVLSSDSFSRKRTLTADLSTEANRLYSERHFRLRAAAKDYTVYKRNHKADWAKRVARDDKDRPGKPKIPTEIINQLPIKAERELALEWTAAELNRRHKKLGATANTVRTLLRRARAVGKTEPNVH